jgi:hypothetical protein
VTVEFNHVNNINPDVLDAFKSIFHNDLKKLVIYIISR